MVNPFISVGDDNIVTPNLGKLVLFTESSSLGAMNQWYGGWCANTVWLAKNNYAPSYSDTIGGLSFTVDITNINESTTALTHLSNSFAVSGNGTTAPEITGAEIGDTFTVTLTLSNGASVSKDITVGPDAYANISSDGRIRIKSFVQFLVTTDNFLS